LNWTVIAVVVFNSFAAPAVSQIPHPPRVSILTFKSKRGHKIISQEKKGKKD